MATERLNAGATSFAAANWSGSGIADDNDYLVENAFGPVTGDLNQSSASVESFWFTEGSSGVVGGGSNGSLLIDADSSSDAFIRNMGKVTLFLAAGGNNTLVNNLQVGGGSRTHLTGGTFTNVYQMGGMLTANGSATITNAYLWGGESDISYLSTKITNLYISGGNHTIKRAPTNLYIGGGRVTIDADDAADFTGTTVDIHGGVLDVKRAPILTINAYGGLIDARNPRVSQALGGTAFNVYGGKVLASGAVDVSAITYPAGVVRVPEGGVPISG